MEIPKIQKIQVTKDLQNSNNSTVNLSNGKKLAVKGIELTDFPTCETKCLKLLIDNNCYGIQYRHNRDLKADSTNEEFDKHWGLSPFKSRHEGWGCLTQRLTPYYAENWLYDEDENWIPCVDFSIYQLNKDWVLEIILAPESFEYKEVNG